MNAETGGIERFTVPGRPSLGPYSDVARVGGLLFLAGRIGVDADGRLVEGGIKEQTRQAVANIREVLSIVDRTLDDVVKATVYLVDMSHFAAFNEAYGAAFGGSRPARTTVAVAELPMKALVEIDVIATAGPSS